MGSCRRIVQRVISLAQDCTAINTDSVSKSDAPADLQVQKSIPLDHWLFEIQIMIGCSRPPSLRTTPHNLPSKLQTKKSLAFSNRLNAIFRQPLLLCLVGLVHKRLPRPADVLFASEGLTDGRVSKRKSMSELKERSSNDLRQFRVGVAFADLGCAVRRRTVVPAIAQIPIFDFNPVGRKWPDLIANTTKMPEGTMTNIRYFLSTATLLFATACMAQNLPLYLIEPGDVVQMTDSAITGSVTLKSSPYGNDSTTGGGCLVYTSVPDAKTCTYDSECGVGYCGNFNAGNGRKVCWHQPAQPSCHKSPVQPLPLNIPVAFDNSTPAYPAGVKKPIRWRVLSCQNLFPFACAQGPEEDALKRWGNIKQFE